MVVDNGDCQFRQIMAFSIFGNSFLLQRTEIPLNREILFQTLSLIPFDCAGLTHGQFPWLARGDGNMDSIYSTVLNLVLVGQAFLSVYTDKNVRASRVNPN
jgi:hypothetical protein